MSDRDLLTPPLPEHVQHQLISELRAADEEAVRQGAAWAKEHARLTEENDDLRSKLARAEAQLVDVRAAEEKNRAGKRKLLLAIDTGLASLMKLRKKLDADD